MKSFISFLAEDKAHERRIVYRNIKYLVKTKETQAQQEKDLTVVAEEELRAVLSSIIPSKFKRKLVFDDGMSLSIDIINGDDIYSIYTDGVDRRYNGKLTRTNALNIEWVKQLQQVMKEYEALQLSGINLEI